MGWLGGSDITTVGTSVSRVAEDKNIHASWRIGAVKALANKGDITEYVSEEMIASMGVKGRQYFNYAKSSYLYGLPSGQVKTPSQGAEQVERVIEALEGTNVLLAYSFYGTLNYGHLAWKAVNAAYAPGTGNSLPALSAAKGTPVTLVRVEVTLSAATRGALSADALQAWGKPFTVVESAGAVGVSVGIVYSWTVVSTSFSDGQSFSVSTPMQESATVVTNLDVSGYVAGARYFHAAYRVGSLTKYWEYRIGAGTYPTLDSIFDTTQLPLGSYFPFAYFRYEKVSMKDPSQLEGYNSTKRLLKKIGIGYDALIDSIHQNPDIAQVEQAMMIMAVPGSTSNAVEQEYLFRYFSSQFVSLKGEDTELSQDELSTYLLTNSVAEGATVVIEDARFKMALDHKGLYRRQVLQSIGSVGTYASGIGTVAHSYTYTENTGHGNTIVRTGLTVYRSHWYRKQVSNTEYEELQVIGLSMKYFIEPGGYGGWYTTTGTGDDAILLVPLDISVTDQMPLRKREELYTRAMHYVFNSVTVTHLAWYQAEWISDLLLIAAVVFTVVSLGEGYATLEAAVAIGTITLEQAIYFVVNKVIYTLTTMAASALFIKVAGIKIAIIVAIIAIATGAYQSLGTESFAKSFQEANVMGVNLVGAVNNLTESITKSIQADFLDLQKEMADFEDYKTANNKLLEDAEKLLNRDTTLVSAIIPGESIGDLVDRTTHYGNIGTVALDAIHNYVERSLTLPTFNDTMGKSFNGLSS